MHGLTFRTRGAALLELMLAPAPQRIRSDPRAPGRRSAAARARPGPGRRARPRPRPPGERSRPRRGRRRGARAAARLRLRHRGRRRQTTVTTGRAWRRSPSAGAARGRGPVAAARGAHAGGPRSRRRSRRRCGRVGPVGSDRQRRGGAERQPPVGARWRGGRAGEMSSARSRRPLGVRILVLRDRAAPMVAVEAAWAGGARAEDAASNGAGALIAALLIGGRAPARRRKSRPRCRRSAARWPASPSQPLRPARQFLPAAGHGASGSCRLPAAPELPGERGRRAAGAS